MPTPLAICLEDLAPRSPAERYLRCVALVGRRPGLRLDGTGTALWKSDDGAACELWVSADDRLIAYRRGDGAAATLRRGGRSLALPPGKPVVVLDQDELEVGGGRLRVHVHARTAAEREPSWMPAPAVQRTAPLPRAAAAALALGAALGAAGCPTEPREPAGPTNSDAGTEPIEVRDHPPEMAPEPEPPPPPPPPIEVREDPPDMMVEE
jgi:hypothetical protein